MAKKNRGRNEGSVFQLKTKKWRAQIYQSGKRISRNFTTKEDALVWLRTTQVNMDRGYNLLGGNITLEEYLASWLENRRISLRTQTAHAYERVILNHITPFLGKKKLRDLRLIEIENFYSMLVQNGLGPRTVRVVHNILHSSLAKAVRYGLIVFNPTQGASLPRYSHEEMNVLDTNQVAQFLVAAQASPYYALFHLAITTGMRIGELLGLKWIDVQWNAGVIHVQRQMQDVPGDGSVFLEPKTNAGRRTIKLGEGSLDVLRRHKKDQDFRKLVVGKPWRDMDLVFANSRGGPGVTSNIRREYKRVLDLAGLPRIRFHDLRHTTASLLLNNKVPVIVVSNMLGHSKPSVTLDIYAHVFHDMQGEAAVVMDRLVTPIPVEIPAKVQQLPQKNST
jgi:integrase